MSLDVSPKIGVELSADSFKAVHVDAKGAVLSTAVEKPVSALGSAERITESAAFITSLKDKFGDFSVAGVAVPGLVDVKTNRIRLSTQSPEDSETDIAEQLASRTGVRIFLENDANAAAYSEFLCGAGEGSRNIFYILLGAGVGGAFIFDGSLWRGASGFAGEFGHITINSEGTKLEDMASAANILRRIKNRFHQDSTSSLIEIGEEAITLDDVVREANKEDYFAQMMLERTGMYVGIGVAAVINLLNIEKIVIGGKIMEAGDAVLNAVAERAKELAFAPCFETTTICSGMLGEFAPAIGAALLARS